jgi:CheY-like chemotaxis protein
MHILLIDDDEQDREIFTTVLGSISARFTCTAFDDAEEALQKLITRELPADLIFTDLRMPGMTGQEFLQAVKQDATLQAIAVIVLSDASDEQTISRARELGAYAFIPKPNTFSAMKKYLLSVLS